ncbi:MAG TPA: acyl carrier protein [Methyloprofundus sp.]|nr:acyl carrier protein [Methyloprofundus sp.]HIM07044.1 acyl carrier protein [Gammaproteobacteria bacterium]
MSPNEQTALDEIKPIKLPLSEDELKDWLKNFILNVLTLDENSFKTSDRFDAYGLDSVEAIVMAGVMEEEFCVIVDPALLFKYPSIDQFAAANAGH